MNVDGLRANISVINLEKTATGAHRCMCVLFAAVWLAIPVFAQTPTAADLTQESLEDLMNVQVTSVSKREQKLSRTGAAIFVLTQEDIHRSGMMNIPDLLRMVPGVNVARIDANTWAISIRGFDTRYSDKVLVLIDGRSVYMPSFSGVYWDQLDVPLENIERFEVIRGPGGTVWGTNAMNGVINIITKRSQDTQSGLITAGTGSEENVEGLAQYGGKIGDSGTYRVFGRYFNIETSTLPNGGDAADAWHGEHGGFRSDWTLSPQDSLTVQGDWFETREGQTLTTVLSNNLPTIATFNDPIKVDSENIVGRWDHALQNGSDISLQVYYDHLNRVDEAITEISDNIDASFQHHLEVGSKHNIVWGFDFRQTRDNLTPGYDVTWSKAQRTDNLYSTFVQDEIRLTKSLSFTIGSKFEHNAYTGFEMEPSAQLVWTPTGHQTVWISAGQAIRQPSRQDAQIEYDVTTFPLDEAASGWKRSSAIRC
ncbi:MAG: TonB-dependent receptor [Bryobacteraceae bacterium]|jgi:iron complex outermembrane receptor protein